LAEVVCGPKKVSNDDNYPSTTSVATAAGS